MLSLYEISTKIKNEGGIYDAYKKPSYRKVRIYKEIEEKHDKVFILRHNDFYFTVGALDIIDGNVYFTTIYPTRETKIKLSEDFINA